MGDSYATRISKQLDQTMRDYAKQKAAEREAKAIQVEAQRQAQAKQEQQPQTQIQPSETRSTLEQVRQDRQAPEKALRNVDSY